MGFNTLDANAQTPPCRNSMSSPLSWMEETLNKISVDLHDFKKDNTKMTQTLVDHATTLTSYGNSLTSLFATQDKQQRELNQLQNLNTTLTQDLSDQTNRITQLEKLLRTSQNPLRISQLRT